MLEKNIHGLYPCKKCGKTTNMVCKCWRVVEHKWWEEPTETYYIVSCGSTKCDYTTHTPEFKTPEGAIDAWNKMMGEEPVQPTTTAKTRQAQIASDVERLK